MSTGKLGDDVGGAPLFPPQPEEKKPEVKEKPPSSASASPPIKEKTKTILQEIFGTTTPSTVGSPLQKGVVKKQVITSESMGEIAEQLGGKNIEKTFENCIKNAPLSHATIDSLHGLILEHSEESASILEKQLQRLASSSSSNVDLEKQLKSLKRVADNFTLYQKSGASDHDEEAFHLIQFAEKEIFSTPNQQFDTLKWWSKSELNNLFDHRLYFDPKTKQLSIKLGDLGRGKDKIVDKGFMLQFNDQGKLEKSMEVAIAKSKPEKRESDDIALLQAEIKLSEKVQSIPGIKAAQILDLSHEVTSKNEDVSQINKLRMVLPLYSEGDLFSVLYEREDLELSPHHIHSLADQILRSVELIHQHGISHRDLKIENLFVDKEKNGDLTVYVADFGLAAARDTIYEDMPYSTGYGTLQFTAPESNKPATSIEEYKQRDCWALGCLLYDMYYKDAVPWSDEAAALATTEEEGAQEAKETLLKEVEEARTVMSNQLKHLPLTQEQKNLLQTIHGLLDPDPTSRLTTEQAIKTLRGTS